MGVQPHLKTQEVAIIIACGGDGSRIGGGKPLRELAGLTLFQRACSWAAAHSDSVAISVRDADQLPEVDQPILVDQVSGIGPISALVSAFEFAQSLDQKFVLMIGCDQPFLPDDLIPRLAAAIVDCPAAMPASLGRKQPLATLWRANPAALKGYLAGGGRSLHRFAQEIGATIVEWQCKPEDDPFFNINDAAALAEAEERIKMRHR